MAKTQVVKTVLVEGDPFFRQMADEHTCIYVAEAGENQRFALAVPLQGQETPAENRTRLAAWMQGQTPLICKVYRGAVDGIETLYPQEENYVYQIVEVMYPADANDASEFVPYASITARSPQRRGKYRGGGRPKTYPYEFKRYTLRLMATVEEWEEFVQIREDAGATNDARTWFTVILEALRNTR